jgi:hypothetical protein
LTPLGQNLERHDRAVRAALEPQSPDVNCLVTELRQEFDRLGRDSSVGQEPHGLSAQRVQLVMCKSSGVGQRLTNVFLFEVGQILHDLRSRISRHTVHTYLDRLYRKLGVNSRAQLISVLFAAYVEMSHTADGD